MKYDPEKHHRRSIRLKNFDYSSEGAYFVTVCIQDRNCLFGEIIDACLRLNGAGLSICKALIDLPSNCLGLEIDEFIVMPNHVHAIFILRSPSVSINPCDGPFLLLKKPLTLFDVVYSFKSWTTKLYLDGVKQKGWTPFPGRLWQRNYYEHIIRDETELTTLREYIVNNPNNWPDDEENPEKPARLQPNG